MRIIVPPLFNLIFLEYYERYKRPKDYLNINFENNGYSAFRMKYFSALIGMGVKRGVSSEPKPTNPPPTKRKHHIVKPLLQLTVEGRCRGEISICFERPFTPPSEWIFAHISHDYS